MGEIALDANALRLRAELRGVDLPSHGCDDLHVQIPQPGEHAREEVA